jgi:hypothetical protein
MSEQPDWTALPLDSAAVAPPTTPLRRNQLPDWFFPAVIAAAVIAFCHAVLLYMLMMYFPVVGIGDDPVITPMNDFVPKQTRPVPKRR